MYILSHIESNVASHLSIISRYSIISHLTTFALVRHGFPNYQLLYQSFSVMHNKPIYYWLTGDIISTYPAAAVIWTDLSAHQVLSCYDSSLVVCDDKYFIQTFITYEHNIQYACNRFCMNWFQYVLNYNLCFRINSVHCTDMQSEVYAGSLTHIRRNLLLHVNESDHLVFHGRS